MSIKKQLPGSGSMRKKTLQPPSITAKESKHRNYRASQEIRRVIDGIEKESGERYTVKMFAEFLGVKTTYLNGILYDNRNPSIEFLSKAEKIRPAAWPKGAVPQLPFLNRVINTHYILTGEMASQAEISLHQENQDLHTLADLLRDKIAHLESELAKMKNGNGKRRANA